MSEVEKKEKQNINNIKALYGLYKEKKMHGLFHEVKRVKFDAYNLAKNFKEEVKNLRRLEEEKEKQKTEEVQYTQEKEKKQTQNTTISTSQQIASTQEQLPDQWQDIDIDAIVDQMPELIEAPIEEPKPKVLIRKRNNTNRSDE